MNIYISGISGTAMGALALFSKKAGFSVTGSDLRPGAVSDELKKAGICFSTGDQDGSFLQKKYDEGKVDWFVYTSALPKNHPELLLARKLGLRVSKRDELIAYLVKKLDLKMVAIAGTHGKTTTTAMIIWTCLKLGLPVSWLEGTTLGFADAGKYSKKSDFLIYEADEYDRNFLHYHPWLSIITVVDYDHPDIYPTKKSYKLAFKQFEAQSRKVISGVPVQDFELAGEVRRIDASLALSAVQEILHELGVEKPVEKLKSILNDFPGAGRRFEKIADGVYSDYAHHPEEVRSTIQIANEEAKRIGAKGVVVVYEPHQNVRQHEVFKNYKDAFLGVKKLFWLPTFLSRENPELRVLTPNDFVRSLSNSEVAEEAKLDDGLEEKLRNYVSEKYLVLLMAAGPADKWLRELFGNI